MMIVMMATDINYVRTFIIQIFLSPDHVGDMMPTRNGMSFLSQSVSTFQKFSMLENNNDLF